LSAAFRAIEKNEEFLELIGQRSMPGYLKTPSESAYSMQLEVVSCLNSLIALRERAGDTDEFKLAHKNFRRRVQAMKFEVASDISLFNPIGSLANMGSLRCGDVPAWVHLILWPGIAIFMILDTIIYR
jgi:hypothetical protein